MGKAVIAVLHGRGDQDLRCPVCGSGRVAWDDMGGYLVCQDCGAIMAEQLIEEEARPPEAKVQRARPRRIRSEATGGVPVRRTLEDLVEEAAARALARGKLIEVRNGTVRLRSPASRPVSEPEVLMIVDILRAYPQLYLRTERVRVGIARYLALRAAGYSRARALAEASRLSGASARSIEKALRAHRKVLEVLEREAATLVSLTKIKSPDGLEQGHAEHVPHGVTEV